MCSFALRERSRIFRLAERHVTGKPAGRAFEALWSICDSDDAVQLRRAAHQSRDTAVHQNGKTLPDADGDFDQFFDWPIRCRSLRRIRARLYRALDRRSHAARLREIS